MSYVSRNVRQPPKGMTRDEQERLLRTTGEHKDGFRDHVIYSLALGTGLREFEIASLNVGDVFREPEKPRGVIQLRVFKGHERKDGKEPKARQEVHLPEALKYKLKTFWRYKKRQGEPLDADEPLFLSARKSRISLRTLHHMFGVWQKRARFERKFKFHALRHTCAYNLYRATRDIRVVQRQLRHSDINTTTIYAVPSDEDMSQAVSDLRC